MEILKYYYLKISYIPSVAILHDYHLLQAYIGSKY